MMRFNDAVRDVVVGRFRYQFESYNYTWSNKPNR